MAACIQVQEAVAFLHVLQDVVDGPGFPGPVPESPAGRRQVFAHAAGEFRGKVMFREQRDLIENSSASACLPSRSRAAAMRESANERKRFIVRKVGIRQFTGKAAMCQTALPARRFSLETVGMRLGKMFREHSFAGVIASLLSGKQGTGRQQDAAPAVGWRLRRVQQVHQLPVPARQDGEEPSSFRVPVEQVPPVQQGLLLNGGHLVEKRMLGNEERPDFPHAIGEQAFILPSVFLPVVHDVQQTLEFLHAFEVGGVIAAAGKGTAPHEAVVIQAVRNEQEAGGVGDGHQPEGFILRAGFQVHIEAEAVGVQHAFPEQLAPYADVHFTPDGVPEEAGRGGVLFKMPGGRPPSGLNEPVRRVLEDMVAALHDVRIMFQGRGKRREYISGAT